jgi:hypothetical protein
VSFCKSCSASPVSCSEAFPTRPVCDPADGHCVECLSHAHCRPEADTDSETDTGKDPAYVSPYGLCTPNRTCTCWVDGAKPTSACTSGKCPAGFVCAEDMPGSLRFACLRLCGSTDDHDTDTDSTNDFTDGLGCTYRLSTPASAWVWAPPTTCHAFAMAGKGCGSAPQPVQCTVSAGLSDGWCVEEKCTYSCADDGYCPADPGTCGTAPPFSGLCLP